MRLRAEASPCHRPDRSAFLPTGGGRMPDKYPTEATQVARSCGSKLRLIHSVDTLPLARPGAAPPAARHSLPALPVPRSFAPRHTCCKTGLPPPIVHRTGYNTCEFSPSFLVLLWVQLWPIPSPSLRERGRPAERESTVRGRPGCMNVKSSPGHRIINYYAANEIFVP